MAISAALCRAHDGVIAVWSTHGVPCAWSGVVKKSSGGSPSSTRSTGTSHTHCRYPCCLGYRHDPPMWATGQLHVVWLRVRMACLKPGIDLGLASLKEMPSILLLASPENRRVKSLIRILYGANPTDSPLLRHTPLARCMFCPRHWKRSMQDLWTLHWGNTSAFQVIT